MYTDAYKIMVMCAEMEAVMSIKKYNKKSVKIRNIIIMFQKCRNGTSETGRRFKWKTE